MGVKDFAISTNHPFNRYRPGQTVRGKVHFNLDDPKTIRGVYVKLKGVGKVGFTERRNKNVVGYSAEEDYFNERIYFSGEDGGDSFELPEGDYNYKFQYSLPNHLPPSFEGNWGSIRYTIKAVLDIPLGFDDEEEIILDIITPINLNRMPHLQRPYHRIKQKHLCCLCCQSGTLRLEINLPKSGYGYGEDIPIRVDVENSTNSRVAKLECDLTQTITFHAQRPQHKVKDQCATLSSQHFRGVETRSTEIYNEVLTVPHASDLNFDDCRILEVSHNLKINANIDGCHTDLSVTIPVTLGSIALAVSNTLKVPLLSLTGLGTPYPYETSEQGDANEESSNFLSNKK